MEPFARQSPDLLESLRTMTANYPDFQLIELVEPDSTVLHIEGLYAKLIEELFGPNDA